MVALTILSVVFLLTLAVVVLRFTTVVGQILDTSASDRAARAKELEAAHSQAFGNAMAALESINQRVVDAQTALFNRTFDAVAGPQSSGADPGLATDDPRLDARTRWQPDDEFDYTGLGIDPTDDTLPAPPMEPEGNEHRAVLLPPGQGLLPQ